MSESDDKRLVLADHPLVGLWSVDIFYSGYQEDTLLAFKADGTGWLEFARHVTCEVDTFDWGPNGDGSIYIRGRQYQGPSGTAPSTFHFAALAYEFGKGTTPLDDEVISVTFAQNVWIAERTFGLCLCPVHDLEVPVPGPFDDLV